MTLLKKTFLYGLGIIALLFTTLLLTLTTQTGLRLSVSLAEKCAPGTLHIAHARGNLLRSFTLDDINYSNEQVEISIEHLDLTWQASHLLAGRISIPHLAMNHVRLQSNDEKPNQKADSPAHSTIPDITLPIAFTVDKLTVNDISINGTDIDQVNFSGKSQGNTIAINSLVIKHQHLTLLSTGSVNLNAPIAIDVKNTIKGSIGVKQAVSATVSLTGSTDQLVIRAQSEAPFKATLNASLLDVLNLGKIDLSAHWDHIIFIPEKGMHFRSQAGALQFAGTQNDYAFTLETDISGDSIPKTVISSNAQGDAQKLSLNKLLIKTLGGQFSGYAKLSWKPILTWEAVLNAENINPGEKWHDIPGDINFTITSAGRQETTLNTRTSIQNLKGSLRKYVIDGAAEITSKDTLITLKNTHFTMGDANIMLNGDLYKHWNLNWNINIPDMYAFSPYGSGSISSKGSVEGNIDAPNIQLTSAIKNVNIDDIKIKQLDVNGNINLAPEKLSAFSINGEKFAYKNHTLDTLKAKFNGSTEKHQLTLALANNVLSLASVIEAGYQEKKWSGKVNTFNIKLADTTPWTLTQPADFVVSGSSMHLTPLVLQAKNQRFSMHGHWDASQKLDAAADLDQLDLANLNALLPTGLGLNAGAELHFRASRENERAPLLAALTGKLTPGTIDYFADTDKQSVAFDGAELNLTVNADGLQSAFVFKVDNKTPLDIQFNLPDFNPLLSFSMEQVMTGKINLAFGNLNIVPTLSHNIDQANGIIASKLILAGTLNNPKIAGTITLKNGLISIPTMGLLIKDIDLSLANSANDTLLLSGKMASGEGELNIKSTITPKDLSAAITVKGENFQAMNTKQYAVTLSPDLTVNYTPEKATIDGIINIINADIQPKDFSSTVALPDNVQYKGEEAQATPFKIAGNIMFNIINPIHFNMMGLDANIIGKLKTSLIPEAQPLGNGELNVTNGSFVAYGQKLLITEARFSYNETPLSNPGMSIRAIRKVKAIKTSNSGDSISNMTVGIIAQGTPNNLHLSLFSDPAGLSEGDILSYIMLGRSQDRASGAQATLLIQALTSSGSAGDSNKIAEKIQNTFGLDELSIEDNPEINPETNEAEDNTSLIIGKKLTKKISLQYSMGFLVPVNVIRIVYNITQRLSAQAEASSVEQGGDVFYTIEK